jgi:5-(carboxyamino)imidazole ribonucleotide synthase
VAVAQDRIAEKSFLAAHGFATAPWAPLVNDIDVAAASEIGVPAILKTARLGYDGKGQYAVDARDTVAAAWQALGGVPCVVERRVPLDVEVSAIVARSASGDTVVYPIAENQHRDGILDMTIVPARVDERLASEARSLAVAVADAFDYVGVLAVEMFVSDGRLLVNELAPRPHNSGHWTLDGANTDQFTQQVRAITGSALGDPSMTASAAAMVNLLGDLWFSESGAGPIEPDWAVALADATAHLHLYGKREARPGRKMGHLTVLGADATAAAESARSLRDRLRRT